MSEIALCPGSFDPITNGHIDIITRAARIFDQVVVLILVNPSKNPLFSCEERVKMVKVALENIPNIEVDIHQGLLAEYAAKNQIKVLVKGLRAVSDFEYEFQQGLTNKVLNHELETVFLNTSSEYMYLSSSIVKQVGSLGGDISSFVSEKNIEDIKLKLKRRWQDEYR